MAKKKVIIHIGSPKTGTTAIQGFCALNAARLAQLDLVYPLELMQSDLIYGQAQHCLVNLFMDATTFWKSINLRPKDMNDEDIISYLKSLSREKNILLSTENLVWLDKKAINTLKEYLAGFDVYVVYYVRRQDDALQALYQTAVALIGETRQFNEYADNVALTLFEYDRIAEDWQSVFGAGKVIIRVYERGQLNDGDVVSDFIHVLEDILQRKIDSSDWDRNTGTVNRGLPTLITDIIRYINNFACKRFIVPKIRRIAELLHKDSRGFYEIISPSARIELLESFAKSNENLARKFLKRKDGILFRDLTIKQTK
jgi:hypothetical protein